MVHLPQCGQNILDILFKDDTSDKIVIVTCDGSSPYGNKYPRVYFQIESWSHLNTGCELSLTHYPTKDNNIHLLNFEKLHIEKFKEKWRDHSLYFSLPTYLKPKKKFCCFVVKNPRCQQRNSFFRLLNNYKKVDSLGPHLNNVDFKIPTYEAHDEKVWDQYLQILSEYKFMICFENKSHPYFITEKLYTAMNAGTIPIYWGCPRATEIFNPERFLMIDTNNQKQDELFQQAINKIIELDNDQEKYQEMVNLPCVLNAQDKDQDFLNRIDMIKERIQNF